MWHYGIDTLVWLIMWAFIGSTLGFFSIRNNSLWTKNQKIREYIKSISVGIFFALPIYAILREYKVFPSDNVKSLNIMIAGSAAFAITDLIIKVWPKLINSVGKFLNKLIDHLINKL